MVTFTITEYTDGTLKVETKHIAFHFRDGLFYDNIEARQLLQVMRAITELMNNKYNMGAVFEIN